MTEAKIAIKSIIWGVLKWLIIVVVGAALVAITTKIVERVSSRQELEYRVIKYDDAVSPMQNIDKIVTIQYGGRKIDRISMVELRLYNRTYKSIEDIEVRPVWSSSLDRIIHKVVLRPADILPEWFTWCSFTDNKNTGVKIGRIDPSWDQSYVARFYFEGDSPGIEKVISTKADVDMAPFDDTRISRMFFGYDTPILAATTIVIAVLYALFLILIVKSARKMQYLAFERVLLKAYKDLNSSGTAITDPRVYLLLSLVVFSKHNCRWFFGKRTDPAIDAKSIAGQLAQEPKEIEQPPKPPA